MEKIDMLLQEIAENQAFPKMPRISTPAKAIAAKAIKFLGKGKIIAGVTSQF